MSIARACERCQERIRELEAGLLGCRQARSELEWECGRLAQLANEAVARAEKAETDARESLRLLRFTEARIAELERWLEDFGITREAAEHRLSRIARATNLEDQVTVAASPRPSRNDEG